MCIRDRWNSQTVLLALIRKGLTREDAYQLVQDAAMRTWEAVSYTHLRAHETVLDLVCRLLLEKKKQITQ